MLRRVWLLLHHLYCAVAMYELTDDGEKALIAGMQRKLRYFFSSRCDLKKRKEKKAKESFPRTPIKEKEKKEKAEETSLSVARSKELEVHEDKAGERYHKGARRTH